jgi:hypothetical protein
MTSATLDNHVPILLEDDVGAFVKGFNKSIVVVFFRMMLMIILNVY